MRITKNQIWAHKNKKGIRLEILQRSHGKWEVKVKGPKGMYVPQQYSTQYIRAHYEFKREKNVNS